MNSNFVMRHNYEEVLTELRELKLMVKYSKQSELDTGYIVEALERFDDTLTDMASLYKDFYLK